MSYWPMLLSLLFLPTSAAAAADPEPRRFEGEVRIVAALPDGVLVAGPGADRTAWFAILDARLEDRIFHRFEGCGRCSLLAAAPLGDGRFLLAGARDERGSGVEEGWAVLIDSGDGTVLRERVVRPPAGGRFVAAAAGYGRLLLAGELFTDAGAGLDGWMVELDPATLEPRDEWRFGGPLPDAAAAILPVASDSFGSAGWRFSAETGLLGGWVARFGAEPRPVWRRLFDGETAFDVAVTTRTTAGNLLLFGHDSRPDEEHRGLYFDLRAARLDPVDGRLREMVELRDADVDRMGIALLGGEGRALALAVRQPHPDGPDALEWLALDVTQGFRPLDLWRDGARATVPAALAVAADGSLLVGGWYRLDEGERGPRGWLRRFPQPSVEIATSPPEPLVLRLEPAAGGAVRVILENRGMTTFEVAPLGPRSVRWLPAGEEPPAAIGAMPGRPSDPLAAPARVSLPAGGRLEAVLRPDTAGDAGFRAVYSPDFTGRGLGRTIVSAPFVPAE